ncbi:glycosyltransferase family 4 protein [Cohnella luojiensis]|uniref:Glycosyltransferase family 1 protein n=1 Tax=Cohnella luojiensis TaxID=652876 RepID=A0A4Y8M026_9BACL|nr:glycosyltransferase family 1 protein [Cohnella luojiensis]TFE28144.1 glycosyltransferase family 1 protein [Cohnella luojiensis]
MADIRLALFTDTYFPEVNGVAKTLERWIGYLRSQGIECMVFAPSRPRKEKTVSEVAERLVSLPFFLYPECRLAVPQTGSVEKKLLSFKPTIIHVATPFGTGVAGRHLAIKHGIPLVASHHTHFVRYLPFYNLQWMGKLLWRYLHWFHRPCRTIYVPSQSVLEECRKDGWEGLEIWSRGVDTERFHPGVDREGLLQENGIPSSRFVVLYAGRMAPEKQTEVAVEAVSLFASRTGADAQLVIAGDGPAAQDIKALASRRGVQARFLGAVTQAELQRWMAASDVLLFPSATETFGNVVVEAMACGLPVLGAAGGAVPDTIRNGENGLLCPPGDIMAFADQLEHLHKDASLRARLSVAGVQEAKHRSWDEVFRGLRASMEDAAGILSATL